MVGYLIGGKNVCFHKHCVKSMKEIEDEQKYKTNNCSVKIFFFRKWIM